MPAIAGPCRSSLHCFLFLILLLLLCSATTAHFSDLSNDCTFSVCSCNCNSQTVPPGTHVSNNLQGAADLAQTKCAGRNATFLLSSSCHYGDVTFSSALAGVSIEAYNSTRFTHPIIGVVSLTGGAQEPSPKISIKSLVWSLTGGGMPPFTCIAPYNKTSLQVSVRYSLLACLWPSTTFSNLFFEGSILPNISQTPFVVHATPRADISFYKTIAGSPPVLHLGDANAVEIAYSHFPHGLTVLTDGTSSISTDHSYYEGPFNVTITNSHVNKAVVVTNNVFSGGAVLASSSSLPLAFQITGNNFTNCTVLDPNFMRQNLFLTGRCGMAGNVTRNTFMKGVLFLGVPTDEEMRHARCWNNTITRLDQIPQFYGNLSIEYNRFQMNQSISKNFIVPPLIDPAISLACLPQRTLSMDIYPNLMVKAEKNWWGNASGPWLCCNSNGAGNFPAQLIHPHYWCLEADCVSYASTRLSQSCIESCCSQELSESEMVVCVLLLALSVLILLTSNIIGLINVKRKFTHQMFQDGRREDMLRRITRTSLFCVFYSSLAALGALAMDAIVFVANLRYPVSPRQERMQWDLIFLSFSFFSALILQISINIILAIAIRLRKKYPTFLRRYSVVFFSGHGFIFAFHLVILVIMVPYSFSQRNLCSTSRGLRFADMTGSQELSFGSPLGIYPTLLMMPLMLVSLCNLIPAQMMSRLLNNFKLHSINSVLEQAALDNLAQSPKVNRLAIVVRVVAGCTIAVGVAKVALSLYSLFHPPQHPKNLPNWVVMLIFDQPRWTSSVVINTFLVASAVTAILVTYAMTVRFNFTILVLTCLCLPVLANIVYMSFDFLTWSVSGLDGAAFVYGGGNMALLLFSILLALLLFCILFSFRRAVLTELPSSAIYNLNTHLDLMWGGQRTLSSHSSLLSPDSSFASHFAPVRPSIHNTTNNLVSLLAESDETTDEDAPAPGRSF